MHLSVDIISNDSKSVSEHSDFYGDDAQTQYEAWRAIREQSESFGPDQPRDIVVTDVTSQDEQQKKLVTREQVMDGCSRVLKMIGIVNSDSHATDDQMDAFFSQPEMIAIILALLTGSPGTAKRKIIKVGPSIYPQAIVDEIVAELAALE